MIQPAPVGAFCVAHPAVQASWACGRCGAFMCPACEQRTRPDAVPMCPACWALREATVAPQQTYSGTALQTTGFVLGFIALFPIPAFQLATLAVNVIGLIRAKEGTPARAVRWKSVVGLCCAGAGLMIDFALGVFAVMSKR